MQGRRNELIAFLGLTFALSAVFYILILRAGSLDAFGGLAVAGLMWCPGIAAMLTLAWSRGSVRGLGWGAGPWKFWLLGYGAPILYAAVVYAMIWLTGLGAIDQEAAARITPTRMLLFIPGSLASLAVGLGEEIGWRGFLTPRLHESMGFVRSSLVTGLIWSAWHYPLLIFSDYNSGAPVAFALACFTVLATAMSFFFAWLRLASNSLWPAALLHASHNLWIQGFFDGLTADTGPTEWWSGEFGAGLALISIPVAMLSIHLWRRSQRNRDPQPAG